MAEDTTGSLKDYLTSAPWKGGASCAACTLPPEVLAQVDDAISSGMRRWRGMVRWLTAQGIEGITEAMLQYHAQRGHHER